MFEKVWKCLVLLVLMVGLWVWTQHGRYQAMRLADMYLVVVDTRTGRLDVQAVTGASTVRTPEIRLHHLRPVLE
jgi:hypothetical protein